MEVVLILSPDSFRMNILMSALQQFGVNVMFLMSRAETLENQLHNYIFQITQHFKLNDVKQLAAVNERRTNIGRETKRPLNHAATESPFKVRCAKNIYQLSLDV